MKVHCFYAVIEHPGNVAACHQNEVKEFATMREFEAWVEFTETELVPDGSTQIVVAATDAENPTVLRYAYIGEPKGDGLDICTVWATNDNIQCPNRSQEFPFEEDIESINAAWLEPGWELRKGSGGYAMCEMHLGKTGPI